MIRVLLKLSSPALRAGLQALLASDKTIKVVNDSLDEENEVDVIITSTSFASLSGLEPALPSSAGVLLLSDDQADVREMKRSSRVWGILPTDSSAEELTAAIHALSQGLIVGAPQLLFESEIEPVERGPLTERELEVLGLLAQGLANKQIAAELGISEHTVKFHVSSIYTKLDVTNRTEAVRAGLRGGWVAL
ncbi:MAG: response regulator transcription factor [Anaerolineae bacterium]|nr:response regulator transcription factor [Anaerolineae bacterium]MBL8105192.1 response regulator transcription factor [Anaerolineales bacterium]MCC6298310.1 response regulator transcription factor [Anaerolineales bacterium]